MSSPRLSEIPWPLSSIMSPLSSVAATASFTGEYSRVAGLLFVLIGDLMASSSTTELASSAHPIIHKRAAQRVAVFTQTAVLRLLPTPRSGTQLSRILINCAISTAGASSLCRPSVEKDGPCSSQDRNKVYLLVTRGYDSAVGGSSLCAQRCPI